MTTNPFDLVETTFMCGTCKHCVTGPTRTEAWALLGDHVETHAYTQDHA